MNIKKYLPLLLSTVCVYGAMALPSLQANNAQASELQIVHTSIINGYNVKQVMYQTGQKRGFFRQLSNGSWVENNSDGRFTFREIGRDEWSVYLLKSDGLRIQLDLHRQEVIWMGQGKLYDIKFSSPIGYEEQSRSFIQYIP